jgi:hypothetical protein
MSTFLFSLCVSYLCIAGREPANGGDGRGDGANSNEGDTSVGFLQYPSSILKVTNPTQTGIGMRSRNILQFPPF